MGVGSRIKKTQIILNDLFPSISPDMTIHLPPGLHATYETALMREREREGA